MMELYENDTILNEVSVLKRILIILKKKVTNLPKTYNSFKINKLIIPTKFYQFKIKCNRYSVTK